MEEQNFDILDLTHSREAWIGVTPTQLLSMSVVVGFMAFDMAMMVSRILPQAPTLEDIVMIGHHLVVIAVYSSVVYEPYVAGVIPMCLMLAFEISTPSLHIRWFLLKTGRSNSTLFWWNGLSHLA